jgi:putative hemolysin
VDPAEIVAPVDPALLQRDVDALPADSRLLSSGAFDVYCAAAPAIPHLLEEIGRLRELTFRAVGEGTGRRIDLDAFDGHYWHLFVWNRTRREVVGGYRLGPTDTVVAGHGLSGLYTTTLFRYDQRMLERLGPALELGRSFVRAEYQRGYNPLLLLWRGIGRFVAREPRYRVLFGPVSISSRYRDQSQQLLRAFLAQEHADAALAELVDPVNPPAPLVPPPREAVAAADVGELDALISRIEGRRGIPVLLRQYMRLNATLLGFNVDPAFGGALDALMMVDLLRLPDSTLERYLGAGARHFTEYHRRRAA